MAKAEAEIEAKAKAEAEMGAEANTLRSLRPSFLPSRTARADAGDRRFDDTH